MLQTLTAEEVAEHREKNFRFVKPGFVVDMGNIHKVSEARYALVKAKNEETQTLDVIPLTQENVFLLLSGTVPPAINIGKDRLLNVHGT